MAPSSVCCCCCCEPSISQVPQAAAAANGVFGQLSSNTNIKNSSNGGLSSVAAVEAVGVTSVTGGMVRRARPSVMLSTSSTMTTSNAALANTASAAVAAGVMGSEEGAVGAGQKKVGEPPSTPRTLGRARRRPRGIGSFDAATGKASREAAMGTRVATEDVAAAAVAAKAEAAEAVRQRSRFRPFFLICFTRRLGKSAERVPCTVGDVSCYRSEPACALPPLYMLSPSDRVK